MSSGWRSVGDFCSFFKKRRVWKVYILMVWGLYAFCSKISLNVRKRSLGGPGGILIVGCQPTGFEGGTRNSGAMMSWSSEKRA